MDFLENLKEREKNILAGVYILLVVMLYFLMTQPNIAKNTQLKTEIIELQEILDAPQVEEKDLDKLRKEIEAIKYSINNLKAQIPDTERRGFLIRDLEALTKENNIELISFIPKEAISVTLGGKEISEKLKRFLLKKKKVPVKGTVMKTAIDIDSTGSFADYKKLFGDIIAYHRAVEIANLVISKSSAAATGVDKRFARKARGKGLVDQFEDETLNVSFTFYAYTLINPDSPDPVVASKSRSRRF